ncbi:hypothetical protein BSKO_03182 [Bryopsis sp. KO-2023]|nr:hypothetical protein BSKO_03182 [Bryopsis sp. KO-2023]
MQAASADVRQGVLYGEAGLTCTSREVAELWQTQNQLQTASGVPANDFIPLPGIEGAHDGHMQMAEVHRAAGHARDLQPLQQSVGLQAALLSGALQQQQHASDARAMIPEALKPEPGLTSAELGIGVAGLATLSGNSGLEHQINVSCEGAGDQGRLGYPLASAQNLSQLTPEYWQQAMALAAVHQAAVAGQVGGSFPLMVPPPNLTVLPPGTQPMPTAALADEKELKKQRRKLSNRESARRSRLRKQAEVNDMIQHVQDFTITNAHLKLEIRHLQQCMRRLRDQNQAMEGLISSNGGGDADLFPSPVSSDPQGQDLLDENFTEDPTKQNQQTCSGAVTGMLRGDRVSEVNQSVV